MGQQFLRGTGIRDDRDANLGPRCRGNSGCCGQPCDGKASYDSWHLSDSNHRCGDYRASTNGRFSHKPESNATGGPFRSPDARSNPRQSLSGTLPG